MSANRCFSTPNESKNSSDYTKQTKQQTIFTDVVNQLIILRILNLIVNNN